jgi:GT2 family glycosyltransferase
MPIRITAAICTHNRAALLPAAIESLLAQSLPPTDYEILVIDNASTDDTPQIIQRYLKVPGSVTLRSAVQPVLGLSHARNLGVEMAAGEIIAFMDDDAVATPGWLEVLLNAYAAFPTTWAAGGKVLLQWQAARPEWLTDDLLPGLSMFDLGDDTRVLGPREFLWGTNCSFRCRAFIEIGMFRTDLGRRGSRLLGQEDMELQQRIYRLGKQIIYVPNALVYHQVERSRLRRRYFVARAYGSGRSTALTEKATINTNVQLVKSIRLLLSVFKKCLESLPRLNDPHARLTCLRRQAFALGYLREAVARRLQVARSENEDEEVNQ